MIKIFTLLIVMIFSFYANAGTEYKNVFKISNVQTIETPEGNYMQIELLTAMKRSDGLEAEGKCLLIIEKGILSGPCNLKDSDGDIRYSKVYRDTNKGTIGTLTNIGGTGKWTNNTEICEYNVDIRNLNIGIGSTEGTCE
mgnify:FL=1